ncbi:C39 family peptidase [Trichocoleus desertorum AS-A10]|uniref:C39 family peptidase n=1 Tax=Trichocoleus desertorum TaxID=1481672 RepID=UPI0032A023D2
MTNPQAQNPPSTPAVASAPPALTYSGPREVLINQAVVLKGTYDPLRIAKVSLAAEDKYPLEVTVDAQKRTWQVNLNQGFKAAGSRWLKLKGTDSAGKLVDDEVIYLTVSTDPMTVGQSLTLKVLRDTLFKFRAIDSARLNAQQKVAVKAGQTFKVSRYGSVDGHLKVVLDPPIAPIGEFGYFFEEHVQLSKGAQVFKFNISDVPNTPLSAQVLVTQTTLIKAQPADSASLAANQKAELLQGQTLQITGYAAIKGHFRVSLATPIQGLGQTGYIYWEHIQIKHNNKVVSFDPDALTATVLKTTVFKKRPVDSASLQASEKFALTAGSVYGVAGYAIADGHIKASLTEELPQFGNTGYLFPDFIQMKRGTKPFNPMPPQVELNVPYFSQRDNPRYSWATCNVTSIAMIFYYYGRRSQGGQLEDELLQWCLNRYGQGSQTDNAVLSEMIKAYGFKTSFSTTRNWAAVKDELINGRPVVMGGDFTATGHIVCVVGYTAQGFIVNDPWGDALSGYYDTEGRKLLYPYSYMDRVAGPDGNVWAHFIAR